MADVEAQIHSVPEHQPASTTVNSERPQHAHGAAPRLTSTTANLQSTNSTHPRPPIAAIPLSQANDHPHVNVPPSQNAGNQGEKYGDSSDAVWSLYLTEAEKQDKDVIESWKVDTDGILVFTGLFSATVATFIIESYQNLSPNPSDTTNALLGQITQQLVNISTGTPLTIVLAQENQPFRPTASTVRINVLWFFSLVLSLTCALSATLMQQWARRYQEFAQSHGAPHRRGRIRAYIYDGIRKFGMARAVATMPLLLHISVFLFLVGLVEFLFPTDKTVSYSTLALVMAFVLAYAIITISPNLYLNCPYATPLSGVTWRLSQLFVIVGLKATLGIEALFHNPIFKLWSRLNRHVAELGIDSWKKALKDKVKLHGDRLSEGLRKSIERNAKVASPKVVPSALEWTLTTLDEDKEIEKFAAGVPGLFNSHTIPDAAILSLLAKKPRTDVIFGDRLYDLLKTCLPGTSPLNDDDRKSRLRVCLKCLWYFGKAYNKLQAPEDPEPLPSYFPLTVVSPEIIQRIQTEPDPLSRVTGHCFGAFIVTKLAADVRSRTNSNIPLTVSEDELVCLSTFLNADRREVVFCLECPGAIELASMVSLASDVIDPLRNDNGTLDALTLGQETLDILSGMAEPHLDKPNTQLDISNGKFDRIIVLPLLNLLQTYIMISGTSGLAADLRMGCLRMCLKSLWYCAKAYHQSGASKPLPSHFPFTLSNPEIIRRIRVEEDLTSRVMGCCFCALVVMKLAADARSRPDSNIQIGDDELACLSTILGTKSDDVKFCLERSGTIELASLVSLALGDLGSLDVSILPSDVFDVVHQTLTTLSQSLPAVSPAGLQLDRPLTQLNILNGEFDRAIASRLLQIIKACFMISGPSPFMTEVRRSCLRMCLMSLWYCAKAYHQLGSLKVLPFLLDFVTPEIIRHIQTENDPVSYVIGRCFQALIVSKGADYIKLRTDSDVQLRNKALTCLSATLGTECDSLRLWLEQPGAMELLNVVFLTFEDIGSSDTDAAPSYVLNVIPQTFRILSQAFPVEMNIELQLEAHADIPDGTAAVTGEIFRNHSIRCLKNLWYHLRAFSQPGNSMPLPSYVLFAFASPTLTHRIRTTWGLATGVMGRCIEALVVKELLTGVKPSSNSSVQIRNNRLAWLSAILGTGSDDVKFCLECPGAVELATMVSLAVGDVGPLAINALPLDVRDVAQQTLTVLSQTAELHLDQPISQLNISDAKFDRVLVSGFHKLLQMCKLDTSPLPAEVRRSCLRMCVKSLWYCAQAYHRPGISKPLPSYFPSMLASPEITRLIRAEQDPISRVVGRCFSALVVTKLVVDVRPRVASYLQVNDDELLCIAAVFDDEGFYVFEESPCSHTEYEWKFRDRLESPGAIELLDIVFFACVDFDFLAADTEWIPPYALDAIQQTFSILSRALPAEINTELELDQMYSQVNVSSDRSAPTIGQIYRNNSIKCLKNLWYRLQAYHQPGNSKSLPSYIPLAFDEPILINRLSRVRDVATSTMGRCIKALVVLEPVAQICDHRQLVAWFSAILDAHKDDVKVFLDCPGTAVLATMATLVSCRVDSSDVNALPSEVRDVVQQTLAILSRTAKLQLDQPIAQFDISDAKFDPIVVFSLRNILQKCILDTPSPPTLTTDVRTSCLRISLKCLWYCAEAYQQLDASEPSSAYFFSTLGVASPEFIHLFQTEQDRDSRVTAHSICALAVMKLMTDVRSRSDSPVQISNDKLTYLSIILGTESDDVKYCLEWPDAVELATIASLALGDFGPFSLPEYGGQDGGLPWGVGRAATETLAIISQAVPAENAVGLQPFNWADIFNGNLARVVVSSLHNLLQVDVSGASALTANVRRSCLRMSLNCLWYCANAYHQPGISKPLPSYFPSTLASPEIIRLIHAEQDPVSRATGRCFGALVVTKLAADIGSRIDSSAKLSDDELTCLSTILGIKSSDVRFCLEWPGVIELACRVSIALGDVGSFGVDALPSSVRDVAQQTLAILSQTAELRLDLSIAQPNFLDGRFDSNIVYDFHYLLRDCLSNPPQSSHVTAEVRRSCLRMSLNCLWYCAKAYHLPGASKPLPSYFSSTFASPEIIRLIQVEQDPVSRVTGRCFGAMVVIKLAADIKSRADSNLPISDEELACISAILGAESSDLKLWFGQPYAIELANILSLISSEIDFLFSDTASSGGLDMMQQTYGILARTLPAELNAKLTNFNDGTSPPTTDPIHERQLRTYLENLWHCARAYNQLGVAVPLPTFVRVTLAGPEFTRLIHAERDITTRVTGRCIQALIVNKLVDDSQSRNYFRGADYDAALAWIQSLLGTEPGELTRWPRPSAIIKLWNVVSLMSGEMEALFTSGTLPANVLQIVQQTLDIICPDLVLRGVFDGEDLPMDQVLPLREICSKIANARPENRFRDETVGVLERLEQISKQLPTVGRKMRRCTSSIFEPQLVRGRSSLTTQKESRRRSKSM